MVDLDFISSYSFRRLRHPSGMPVVLITILLLVAPLAHGQDQRKIWLCYDLASDVFARGQFDSCLTIIDDCVSSWEYSKTRDLWHEDYMSVHAKAIQRMKPQYRGDVPPTTERYVDAEIKTLAFSTFNFYENLYLVGMKGLCWIHKGEDDKGIAIISGVVDPKDSRIDPKTLIKQFDERIPLDQLTPQNQLYATINKFRMHHRLAIVRCMQEVALAFIREGNFEKAKPYSKCAADLAPDNVAALMTWGHVQFLSSDFSSDLSEARATYEKGIKLIKDEETFNECVRDDFEFFIKKGWRGQECRLELERLRSLFHGDQPIPIRWDSKKPCEFQFIRPSDLQLPKEGYAEITSEGMGSVFHYLTDYRSYDYNAAAAEDGEVNQFEIRRLRDEHSEIKHNVGALGTKVPNKFILEVQFRPSSRAYDFAHHAFSLNLIPTLQERSDAAVPFYRSDPVPSKLYNSRSILTLAFTDLPSRLELIAPDDAAAEDWSKSDITCRVYLEVSKQVIAKPRITRETDALFDWFLAQKGYKSGSNLSVGALASLANEFYLKTKAIPYWQSVHYRVGASVKWIELEVPGSGDVGAIWVSK